MATTRTSSTSRFLLLSQYLDFLRDQQLLSEATITIRRLAIQKFLRSIGRYSSPSQFRRLGAKRIHDYVIQHSPELNRASQKHLTSSLRSFLRFAHVRGYLSRDLVDAVPVIATRRLANLPRRLTWDEVQRLLEAPDRHTAVGRRDYAMILLMATYGVRVGQVTTLRRQDIRWHEQSIAFAPSKGGKPLQFPLEKPVAEALLAYLRQDRGSAPFEEVFLTVRGVRRPLGPNNHLGSTLKLYYRRAGIDAAVQGTHVIRHAVATRLLECGSSIKTIADFLGHRYIDTTYIYTKVDIEQLRALACPWPEVQS
jgi:site-specific recombinase XerD